MARKLSLQERESINYITDVLCHALPAAQRSFAGSLASALVRVKGEQITDADLERATEKFGEYQSALIEVAKAKVLDRVPAVDAEGDGEAFTLRVPEGLGEEAGTSGEAASASAEGASDGGATGEKDGAAAEEPPAEKKPARRRRTRRKKVAELEAAGDAAEAAGDAAAAEAAPAAEAEVAAEPEPEAEAKKKSVRPGRGARAARAKAKAEAAEKAEKSAKASGDEKPAGTAAKPAKARKSAKDAGDEKSAAKAAGAQKAALPAAKEAPALPEAAAAAASEPEAVSGSAADAAGAAAPDQASAPAKEAPKKRTRRRRTKKPVEDIVVKGAAAEEFLAKESDAVEAEAGAVANELQAEALLAEKGDAAEATPEVEAAATAEAVAEDAPVVEDATVAPADAPAEEARTDGRSGGRARVRGRGRRGLERRPRGDSLSDVPYVRRGGESETALREQIVQLDPRLWMNGWLLSHPGAFTLYERELRGIDVALQKGELPGDLTRRQLAYKMGGNEKFFEYGSDGHKLLRAMGADDLIGHRLTPKADMLYHVPRRRKNMKILVTENLDPWLDVRDLMYEDGRSLILGERVHGVVLGGGNPVIENNRLAGMLETLGAETVEVLYWGDIDRAGLNLLQRLTAMLEGRYKVTPFMPAYRLMLDRAMERWPDPDQNERTTQENVEVQDFSSMLEGLTDEQAAYFSSIIQKCGLIPQEILTKQDL